VEQTRRLVESDEVALIFSSIGTAHNTAIAKYLQGKNIPQLFIGSGASKFADRAQYPQATLGVQGPFRYEARSMRAMRYEADDIAAPSPLTSPRVRGYRSWLVQPPAVKSKAPIFTGELE
jgi:hypothetical protein